MDNTAYKVVCFDDSNVFEFEVLEDNNCASLHDVVEFIEAHEKEHDVSVKWLLLPIIKQQIKI